MVIETEATSHPGGHFWDTVLDDPTYASFKGSTGREGQALGSSI